MHGEAHMNLNRTNGKRQASCSLEYLQGREMNVVEVHLCFARWTLCLHFDDRLKWLLNLFQIGIHVDGRRCSALLTSECVVKQEGRDEMGQPSPVSRKREWRRSSPDPLSLRILERVI